MRRELLLSWRAARQRLLHFISRAVSRILLCFVGFLVLQFTPWPVNPILTSVSRAYTAQPVRATLKLHTRAVELEMPISLARRKEAFLRKFTDVKTPDGIRLTEPILSHQRQDGSFQVIYNSCPEQDTYSSDNSVEGPRLYGCVARLLSIASAGTQVGGEKNIDFRDILPESRVVGYWTPSTDPVDGQNGLEGVVFAVWAAVCPTAAETCECTKKRCQISLELSGTRSAFLSYAASSLFNVEKGERLCSGTDRGDNRLGRAPLGRFVYWMVEGTGWVCDLADKHGVYVEFDEDHPRGTRVGTIFLVERRNDSAEYDILPILAGARLNYPFGYNTVSVGRLEQANHSLEPPDDKYVAVVVRGRYFDEEAGRTEPGCFGIAVAKSLSPAQRVLPMPCRPCAFAAVLLHPHLDQLLPVCEESGDLPAIFVDGKKAVAVSNINGIRTSFSGALLPVFLADDFRSWNIVWRNITHNYEDSQANSVMSSITLNEWNQPVQVSSEGVVLTKKALGNKHDRLYASFFGNGSLLLAYHEVLDRTTVLTETSVRGSTFGGSSLKIRGNVEGTLLPMSYGDILMRTGRKKVTWYSLWDESSGKDNELGSLTPVTESSRQLRLITVEESEETRTTCTGAFGPANISCGVSCHLLQTYEPAKTGVTELESACPFANGITSAEPCFDGECSFITIENVKTSTSVNAYLAADGKMETSVKSVGSPSVFEIALQSPSEIWTVRAYFIPHGTTKFNVTVMDQRRSVIYQKASRLEGYTHRGLSLWEWRDMLFFRAQYLRLEASLEGQAGEYLEVAEFQVAGRELEVCPADAFFTSASHVCEHRLDFLLKVPAIWDCQGQWGEWSYCDSTCRSTRFLQVKQQALYAGKPCALFEKRPCSDGPFCNAVNPTAPNSKQQDQDCIFVPSGWSECRGCRRLNINHRVREASGSTKAPCPPVLEIEDCGPPCDEAFDNWKLPDSWAGLWTRGLNSADRAFAYLAAAAAFFLVGAVAIHVIACRARQRQPDEQKQLSQRDT